MKRKIISIATAIITLLYTLMPFGAYAEDTKFFKNSEPISLNQSITHSFDYGNPNGQGGNLVKNDTAYFKFTAPETRYYQVQMTGFEHNDYYPGYNIGYIYDTDSFNIYYSIYDSYGRSINESETDESGKYVHDSSKTYVQTSDEYGHILPGCSTIKQNCVTVDSGTCVDNYHMTKGKTYYIQVKSNVSAINSYYSYDKGYASQNLTISIKPHTHTMKIGRMCNEHYCTECTYSYYTTNIKDHLRPLIVEVINKDEKPRYDLICENCATTLIKNLSLAEIEKYDTDRDYIDLYCRHNLETKTKITKMPTYWENGSYSIVCCKCGKTLKHNVKINKKSAALKSVKVGRRKAFVNWKRVPEASGYVIQYSTKKNMKNPKSIKVKAGSKTSKTIKKLKKGKKYYFRVKACSGKKSSSWSKIKSVKIKK